MEYKCFRPVRLSSSSATQTLPDSDGQLSEKVPAKAIELAIMLNWNSQKNHHMDTSLYKYLMGQIKQNKPIYILVFCFFCADLPKFYIRPAASSDSQHFARSLNLH